MAQLEMTPESAFTATTTPYPVDVRISSFLRAVYGWMFVGLCMTALVAAWVGATPDLVHRIMADPASRWTMILTQLGIVVVLAGAAGSLPPVIAAPLFLLYSGLTGVTVSMVVARFSGESIATTFLVTAGMFGSMAVYGTVTRNSLAGWGQFLFMGLVGLVLASFVGVFFSSPGLRFVLSIVSVIVFTGLAAYDAQRLKVMALAFPESRHGSYAVVGALVLYLDFINLFLTMLRFFGKARR